MPSVGLASDIAAFYSAQSAFSDPGGWAARFDGLGADPAELARIARGLMIHRLEGGIFGVDIPVDRLHDDAETRYVDDILRIVVDRDPAPLDRPRAPGDRFVGVCRDFALLHCALLRHAGVPARVRYGFANYFDSTGFHHDHMVTEYWDGDTARWRLADAQLADPVVATAHRIDFDPMDVPREDFLVAGKAWRAVRARRAHPASFGVAPGTPLHGEWFVVGCVRIDLAAVNRVESLLWDVWGAGAGSDAEMTDEIRALYDEVAVVTGDDVPFAAARALFAGHDGLRTPASVLSLAPFNGPVEVALR
ncbi:MAG TPA: transglutaminase-like domain-containing protein [Pseudonocardiaceae bacterium]|nr:transglutaminase-like domain-containing protein [Pseudonocardiaceae bacterium]